MSIEDKLPVLDEARSYLEMAIKELQENNKEFKYYIDCISSIADEMLKDIEELEESQNKIWKEEMKEANREFESMRL